MSASVVILVLLVVAAATAVRSVWGFGDAMLALPLLSLLVGLEVGIPLMALASGLVAARLLRERSELVETASVARLLGGALLGAPIGLYLIVGVPLTFAHAVLGAMLVGFAGWSLAGRPGARSMTGGAGLASVARGLARGPWLDLGFGVLAGASSAAFDIAGPPLLIYAAARGWSADELRVNLQAVFLPLALLTMASHALGGLWTAPTLSLAVLALPVVFVVAWQGPRLRARVQGKAGSERVVYALIFVLGLVELGRATFGG